MAKTTQTGASGVAYLGRSALSTGRNPATYHWFRVKGANAFTFAGIWKNHKAIVGDTPVDGVFYSMVTTEPNELLEVFGEGVGLRTEPE